MKSEFPFTKLFKSGDFKTLSRAISFVENELPGYEDLLMQIPPASSKIIGITGPPGAGKSSMTDALIGKMVADNKKIGVLCIDPSSPFNKGALLGDRIRMSEWYTHPNVFIRSLASRGALGGLHPKIIEIADLMKAAGFDYVIIETVGVGQSEVDIAGLADITVVMLVPEAGDIIQTMKAGLMEVADIFVVNKSDRPGADIFYNHLKKMLSPAFNNKMGRTPVLKTIASKREGVSELYTIIKNWKFDSLSRNHVELITQRVWSVIQNKKMEEIDLEKMKIEIEELLKIGEFNLYQFVKKYA